MKSLLLTVALIVFAGTAAVAQTPGTADAHRVFVGGTTILRVQTGAGGMSATQRARHIQDRVNHFLGMGPIRPSQITVEPLGNEATVDVKGHLLFTADWATARFNNTTPMALADEWAARMRRVLPDLTKPK
jgi:hypothetical protein